jgi:transcriptional regulator with XRE-family HTH domain
MQAQELANVFRANMRTRRNALGISQTRLADALHVPQSYVSDLERGRISPNVTTLAALAEALDTTPSLLISPSAVLVP